jgi:hypothetical protein
MTLGLIHKERAMKSYIVAGLLLSTISLESSAMEIARIQALRSGVMTIDGRPSSMQQLASKLHEIRAANGMVLYFREQPRLPATAWQQTIFNAVMAADVPVEFHRAADFSDRAHQ